MKYPQKQYTILVEALKQLAPFLDLKACNPHALHYLVAQQFDDGQPHNWLYCVGSDIKRGHQLTASDKENGNSSKFIDIQTNFELYPDGCNDTHILTAMKAALKELGF